MKRIHLVEDEENLNDVLKSYLENEGFFVSTYFNGEDAIHSIKENPDLWILDIMLPGIDGFDLIEKIKEHDKYVPVIFISARDADLDRVKGLEMGSDDYLAKPFLPKELVIRTKKILERVYQKSVHSEDAVQVGSYQILIKDRQIINNEEAVDLSSKEFDFILTMIKHPGEIFSRDELLKLLWEENYFGSSRVVDDLVRRVRKKLPLLNIETVYSFGYRLNT